MPKLITQFYEFTGWSEVLIYSESEMAEAIGVTPGEFRRLLEAGKNYLSYHAAPVTNMEREYWFTEKTYQRNNLIWKCKQAGGHYWEKVESYDLNNNECTCWQCRNCPAERYD